MAYFDNLNLYTDRVPEKKTGPAGHILSVVDTSLASKFVIRELNKLIAWRGQPSRIRVDNGPEFITEVLQQWSVERNIDIKFIEKVNPIDK